MSPEFRVVADRGDDLTARTPIACPLEESFEAPAERKPKSILPVGLRRDRDEHGPLERRESPETKGELVQRRVERRLEGGVDEDDEISEPADHAFPRVPLLLFFQRLPNAPLPP